LPVTVYCYALPSRTDSVILVTKILINLRRYLRKLPVIFVLFQTNLNFLDTLQYLVEGKVDRLTRHADTELK